MLPYGGRELRRGRRTVVGQRRRLRTFLFLLIVGGAFLLGRWTAPPPAPSATVDARTESPKKKSPRAQQHQQPLQKPQQPVRTSPHTYRDDGLLEVNPNGVHPVFALIARAEEEWNAKLRKASATLGEAVEEYQRRYGRLPPKGFDKWCVMSL